MPDTFNIELNKFRVQNWFTISHLLLTILQFTTYSSLAQGPCRRCTNLIQFISISLYSSRQNIQYTITDNHINNRIHPGQRGGTPAGACTLSQLSPIVYCNVTGASQEKRRIVCIKNINNLLGHFYPQIYIAGYQSDRVTGILHYHTRKSCRQRTSH